MMGHLDRVAAGDRTMKIGSTWIAVLILAGAVSCNPAATVLEPEAPSFAREADQPDGDWPDTCEDAATVTLPFADDLTVDPEGDFDWFRFEVDSDVVVAVETFCNPEETREEHDTRLWLLGSGTCADIQVVAYNDDKGPDWCSRIETGLHPGTYYVAVSAWGVSTPVDLEVVEVRPANPPPPDCEPADFQTACAGGPCDCTCAGAVCTCPPTYQDEAELLARMGTAHNANGRWCASHATLDAFQHFFDTVSPGSTLQLQPGIYDWSGIVYKDDDFPYETEYYAYNYESPVCAAGGTCFGTHHFESRRNKHDGGSGVAALGVQDLAIRGAVGTEGQLLTEIRGNLLAVVPEDPAGFSPASWWYNTGWSFGGGASGVSVEDIHFADFQEAVVAYSHYIHPTSPGANMRDAAFAGGTTDLRIERNTFTNTGFAVSLHGHHESPRIEGNTILMGDLDGWSIIAWGGRNADATNDNPERIVDLRVEGNTIVFDNPDPWTAGVFVGWDYGCGTIRENTIVGAEAGVSLAGTSGCVIEENEMDGVLFGVTMDSFWIQYWEGGELWLERLAPRDNVVRENEIEAPIAAVLGYGAQDNLFEENRVTGEGCVAGFAGFGGGGSEWIPSWPEWHIRYFAPTGNIFRENDFSACGQDILIGD